jgi:hypothetical protein
MSNLLGDVGADIRRSSILSHAELLMREQQGIQKNMNFRDDGVRPSVFLISDRGEDSFTDEWHEDEQVLIYEGHDKTAAGASKKSVDQELMHESGHLSDNGKFYKAAQNYKDGVRSFPLQIQVYERLDAGVWYDKGLFNLIDAMRHMHNKRRTFKFVLAPADGAIPADGTDIYRTERVIPTKVKEAVWLRDRGRCGYCGTENALCFHLIQSPKDGGSRDDENNIQLRCSMHSLGRRTGFL